MKKKIQHNRKTLVKAKKRLVHKKRSVSFLQKAIRYIFIQEEIFEGEKSRYEKEKEKYLEEKTKEKEAFFAKDKGSVLKKIRNTVVAREHRKHVTVAAVLVLGISLIMAWNTSFRSHAAFFETINYQARITDTNNVDVANGSYNMRFRICSDSSCSSVVWTETRCYSADGGSTCTGAGTDQRVAITSGIMSVMLGEVNSLSSVNFDQTLYLETQIAGAGATPATWEIFTPRKKIGTVPTSLESKRLSGKTWDAPGAIGSTTPNTGKFTTLEAVNTGDALILSGVGANISFTGAGIAQIKTATGQGLALMPGGNVGINISNPTLGRLQISENTTTDGVAGLRVDHAGGVTGTGYGIYVAKSGISTKNIAGYFSSSGGTLNYGLIVANGDSGFSTNIPSAKVDVFGTFASTSGDTPFTASKSGTTITATSGTFTSMDSGKFFVWSNGTIDKITSFTDGTHVVVESSGTISSQAAYLRRSNFYVNADGNVGAGTVNPTAILSIRSSGSGTAFAVRNTTDTSTKFFITDLGQVSVGGGNISGNNIFQMNANAATTSALTSSIFEIDSESGTASDFLFRLSGGVNYEHPGIILGRSRGTSDTPTATQSTDTLGGLWGMGYTGTAWRSGAAITYSADGTFVGNNAPSQIGFFTTTTNINSGSMPIPSMVIKSNGKIGVGTNAPAAVFDVQKSIAAASGTAYGVSFTQTLLAQANSDVLTALRIVPTYTNASYTTLSNYGIHLTQNIADATVPTYNGIVVENTSTGDANMRFFSNNGTTQNITFGIDGSDNKNFKISNTTGITGTTYADANTMMRIHTESGSEGIIDFNHQSRARAYRNTTTQAIANNTWLKVQLNAENFDEKSEFDSTTNYRFTAKEDGYYQISGRVRFTTPTNITLAGAYASVAIYLNGALYSYGNNLVWADAGNDDIDTNNGLLYSDLIYMTAGQYIELWAFQNSGNAATINLGSAETYLSIHKSS